MSYYYLSHRTIRHLVKHAKRSATFADVLSWMCSATEYDELPVRHNEDLINAELSKNLPIPASAFDNLPMWDPHVKAFLLLQAHMSRIDLPISDYVGDQTSVLDQAIRVMQASIDVLTELGYLSSVLQMITLMQCIKSARWPTDWPLSVLPGMSTDSPTENLPTTLQEITAQNERAYQNTLATLQLGPAQSQRFQKAALILPNLSIAIQDLTALSLSITLTRVNNYTSKEGKIHAPRFPKSQTEGWFVIVCREDRDEIVALKRVGIAADGKGRAGKLSAKADIKLVEEEEGGWRDGRKLDVWVVSDAYVGMVYKIEGVEIPNVPRVRQGDKEKGKEV